MMKRVLFVQMICLLTLFGCHDTTQHGHDHNNEVSHEHGDDHGHDHATSVAEHGTTVEPGAATEIAADPAAMTVKAGCAMCIFGMEGVETCTLAVEIEGRAYLVAGTAMMDHGDAHGEHGMCNMARQAVVKGEVVDEEFVAEEFALLTAS